MLVKTDKENRKGLTLNMAGGVELKFNEEGIAETSDANRSYIEPLSGSPYFLTIIEGKPKSDSVLDELSDLNEKQLREFAKSNGIKVGSTAKKETIIAKITEHLK